MQLLMLLMAVSGADSGLPKTLAATNNWYQCAIPQLDKLNPGGESAVKPIDLASEAIAQCKADRQKVADAAFAEIRPAVATDEMAHDLAENILVGMAVEVHAQLTALATVVANSRESGGPKGAEGAIYAAGSRLSECAKTNAMRAILEHDLASPAVMAENAVMSCTAERRAVRSAGYTWFATITTTETAAAKADALEFDFRALSIQGLREEIRKAVAGVDASAK